MRIALIMPYDLARPGGVRTHTLALARRLRQRGHDAQVLAPSSDPAAADQPWIEAIGKPRPVRFGGSVGDAAIAPGAALRLRKRLNADWDIIHIQEPLVPLLGPLALYAAPRRAPTVLTFHSAEQSAQRLYERYARVLRPLVRRAAARIVVSTAALDTARPILAGPAAIIPPCIEPFDAESAAPPADDAGAAILYVGRDEPRKGLPILLAAFALLENAQATLDIAGPMRPTARKLVELLELTPRVRFHGSVSSGEVRRLLARSTLLCAPAMGGEALGLVLVEAMAAGLPVVASDIDGYRIAARGGRAALLVPPGDAVALTEAIEQALADPRLRGQLSAAGRAASRRFDAAIVGDEHIRVYNRLLG